MQFKVKTFYKIWDFFGIVIYYTKKEHENEMYIFIKVMQFHPIINVSKYLFLLKVANYYTNKDLVFFKKVMNIHK